MRHFLLSLFIVLCSATLADSTVLWSSTTGDVNFPGMTPTSIDNTPIGQTTQAPVGASQLTLDSGFKTAAATAGAATLSKIAGIITSESLTTAAGATYTLTVTDSKVLITDQIFASVQLGSSTTGVPVITSVTPGSGSFVVVVQNIHASAAFNGTIKISFADLKN